MSSTFNFASVPVLNSILGDDCQDLRVDGMNRVAFPDARSAGPPGLRG